MYFPGLRAILILCLLPIHAAAQRVHGVVSRSIFWTEKQFGKLSPVVSLLWELDPFTVRYEQMAGGLRARLVTSISLRTGDSVLHTRTYTDTTQPVPDAYAAAEQLLSDHFSISIPEGDSVVLELRVAPAVDSSAALIYHARFAANRPPDARHFFSDIRLLDTVLNGDVAVPLAVDFLDESRRHLSLEVQTIFPDGTTGRAHHMRTYVSRRPDDVTGVLGTEVIAPMANSGDNRVHRHFLRMPVGAVPSGNWWAIARLEDSAGALLALQTRAFQRLNRTPDKDTAVVAALPDSSAGAPRAAIDLSTTFVAGFTPQQLRAVLKMIAPVADATEAAAIAQLLGAGDPAATRYFLYGFFSARNRAKPAAAWKDYSDRVRTVNRMFRAGLAIGFETPRGRVQLQYGPPSDRIQIPREGGSLPYEVWNYTALPGTGQAAQFLFYQPSGLGSDFVLLHSTAPGEPRNPGWRPVLYPGGGPYSGAGGQAERYFGKR